MKILVSLLVAAASLPSGATPAPAPAPPRATNDGQQRQQRSIRIGATLYGFAVPDQPDFPMAVATAERHRFHIEGRYNYEGLHTGTIFVGLTGHAGDRLALEATGMVGGVFGDIVGVAPAVRLVVSVWKLDFLVEAEYVFDLGASDASFFYSWSEIGFSPIRGLRAGIVVQRTRVLANDLDLQRGVLLGVTIRDTVTVTAYELNLGWIHPTFIGAIGVDL
jgi:hypothetical protein